jgi:hypothetical protein
MDQDQDMNTDIKGITGPKKLEYNTKACDIKHKIIYGFSQ